MRRVDRSNPKRVEAVRRGFHSGLMVGKILFPEVTSIKDQLELINGELDARRRACPRMEVFNIQVHSILRVMGAKAIDPAPDVARLAKHYGTSIVAEPYFKEPCEAAFGIGFSVYYKSRPVDFHPVLVKAATMTDEEFDDDFRKYIQES